MKTTRRRFLSLLAALPGGALVARWLKPEPEPEAPIFDYIAEKELWLQNMDRLHPVWSDTPRTVTVAERFGPGDKALYLEGAATACSMGCVVSFDKGYGRRVMVRILETHPYNKALSIWAARLPDKHSQRITLQPGDVGVVLGKAETARIEFREDIQKQLDLYWTAFPTTPPDGTTYTTRGISEML